VSRKIALYKSQTMSFIIIVL